MDHIHQRSFENLNLRKMCDIIFQLETLLTIYKHVLFHYGFAFEISITGIIVMEFLRNDRGKTGNKTLVKVCIKARSDNERLIRAISASGLVSRKRRYCLKLFNS